MKKRYLFDGNVGNNKWIEERIRLLSSIFGIEIFAYAVMSNHIHIVVKLCHDEIDALSPQAITERWTCLFKGSILIQKHQKGEPLTQAEQEAVDDSIDVFRARLKDVGWFMKCLNQPIARQANREDDCTGHFWEGRYKSQALLTEAALLSCMAYVDLNPIRAKIADTPECSDHTSIKERIKPSLVLEDAVKKQIQLVALLKFNVPLRPLAKFEGNITNTNQTGILFSYADYLTLVDTTGRVIREDKRGAIESTLSPILDRLAIDSEIWMENCTQFERHYQRRFAKRRTEKSA